MARDEAFIMRIRGGIEEFFEELEEAVRLDSEFRRLCVEVRKLKNEMSNLYALKHQRLLAIFKEQIESKGKIIEAKEGDV